MQIARWMLGAMLIACASLTCAADGLIVMSSPYSAAITVQRLENEVKVRGLTIFARVDHAAGAAKAGLKLRPTILLIFGNPKGGTPFMLCEQTVGIDLPLKALVWQDESGQVWLGYNDPAYIAKRHGITACPVVGKLQEVLQAIAQGVVAP
jgi:uncharacterized protein (DUF302 family)